MNDISGAPVETVTPPESSDLHSPSTARTAILIGLLSITGVLIGAAVSGVVAVAVADRQIRSSEDATLLDVRRAVYSDFLTRSTQMELRLLEIAETGSDVYLDEQDEPGTSPSEEVDPLVESVVDAYADLLQANVQLKLVAPDGTRELASDHVLLVGEEALGVVCQTDDSVDRNCTGVLVGLLVEEVESRPTTAVVQTDPADGLIVAPPPEEATEFGSEAEVAFDSDVQLSVRDVAVAPDDTLTKGELNDFKLRIRESREEAVRAFRSDMKV